MNLNDYILIPKCGSAASITETADDTQNQQQYTSFATLSPLISKPEIKSNFARALLTSSRSKSGRKQNTNQPHAIATFNGGTSKQFSRITLRACLSLRTAAAGVDNYMLALNPSTCTNWTALTSLFDQYRINRVTVKLCYQAHYGGDGVLAIALDQDGTSAPADIDEVLQYGDVWYGSLLDIPGSHYNQKQRDYTFLCLPSGSALANGLGAWCDIATVASTGCCKIATTSAVNVGLYIPVVSYEVDFRSIR